MPKICLNVPHNTVLAHFVELQNAPVGHMKKGSNEKFAKTIFYFLNTEALGMTCTLKVKEQAVNLNDGICLTYRVIRLIRGIFYT